MKAPFNYGDCVELKLPESNVTMVAADFDKTENGFVWECWFWCEETQDLAQVSIDEVALRLVRKAGNRAYFMRGQTAVFKSDPSRTFVVGDICDDRATLGVYFEVDGCVKSKEVPAYLFDEFSEVDSEDESEGEFESG